MSDSVDRFSLYSAAQNPAIASPEVEVAALRFESEDEFEKAVDCLVAHKIPLQVIGFDIVLLRGEYKDEAMQVLALQSISGTTVPLVS
jgi:hypothetical protein